MVNDIQKITLHINGRDIILNVEREKEAAYREAAKICSQQINYYTEAFSKKNKTNDIDSRLPLVYSLLNLAFKYVIEKENKDTNTYDDILTSLTKEIEDNL